MLPQHSEELAMVLRHMAGIAVDPAVDVRSRALAATATAALAAVLAGHMPLLPASSAKGLPTTRVSNRPPPRPRRKPDRPPAAPSGEVTDLQKAKSLKTLQRMGLVRTKR